MCPQKTVTIVLFQWECVPNGLDWVLSIDVPHMSIVMYCSVTGMTGMAGEGKVQHLVQVWANKTTKRLHYILQTSV